MRSTLFLFALSIAAIGSISPSVHAQKVIFAGDDINVGWQADSSFTANTNWVGEGVVTPGFYGSGALDLLAMFPAILNQHPAVVHILVGGSDLGATHDATPIYYQLYDISTSVTAMVAMARRANVKIILGTLPNSRLDIPANVRAVNAWIEEYGLANGIPVVNYHDALCLCVDSAGTPNDTFDPSLLTPQPPGYDEIPNAAGYAVMTELAATAIASLNGVKSGYLNNTSYVPNMGIASNVNIALIGQTIQFIPYGLFSDGKVRQLNNTNFLGSNGTWTTSNPNVMSVTADGIAFALSPGKARISHKTPAGVAFSPWDMTVETFVPGDF